MSLAQHVTQGQGFDYDGAAGPISSEGHEASHATLERLLTPNGDVDDNKDLEWRRMSFAPVEFKQEGQSQRTAAYRVSNFRRAGEYARLQSSICSADSCPVLAQVSFAVIACWLGSGIVFGFAALKPVLIAEGVYSDLCLEDDSQFPVFAKDGRYDVPCAAQDMRLNLFFVSASITANISCLLAGAALDRFGRRFCWIVSCGFIALGCVLMGLSSAIAQFDGYLAGNIFLALGGTFLFVPSFQLANAFQKHSGLIVALITGAFDASAAVFLFYRLLYESSGGRFTLEKFFFGYLVVPAVIFITEMTLMPAHAYHTVPELQLKIERAQDPARDVHESDDELSDNERLTQVRSLRAENRQTKLDQLEQVAGDSEHRQNRLKEEKERQEISEVWGVLHGLPVHHQMLTPWYILILLLTVLQMLRMNYFIATIRSQYEFLLASDTASDKINRFFDIALPVGGVISTPFIGLFLNNVSVPTIFGVLTIFVVGISVFNCLPYLWAGYITVIAFVFFRPLYYSAIS
jgi:MFS family permease